MGEFSASSFESLSGKETVKDSLAPNALKAIWFAWLAFDCTTLARSLQSNSGQLTAFHIVTQSSFCVPKRREASKFFHPYRRRKTC